MPLLGLFDRTFSQRISDRFESASQFKEALFEMENDNNAPKDEQENDLEVILASLNSRVNQQIARNKLLYDMALRAIQGVHGTILQKVSPTFVSYQTGYVNFADGLKNDLGFSHFATHDMRFVPHFLIKIVGEEIVVYADDRVLHRTDVNGPTFGQEFQTNLANLYLRGLRELIER